MSVLDKIVTDSKAHPARLRMAKQNSRKLVGYTGRFVPEEIIRAVGAIPHYLCRGGEPEAPEAVLPYMLRFMSPYSRAQIGYHLMGMDPVMKLLIIIGIVMMVIGSLGIAGGVLAIKKRSWPIALAGAIAGLITFYQIGIAAIVFTVMAKDEFTSKKGVNHFNQPAISPPVIS